MAAAKPYVPHSPSAIQAQFLALEAEEALFGGATGSGKSDAALFCALQFVHVPGYSAGIFRLTDEDWNEASSVLNRARKWFAGTDAVWDSKLNGYRFPSSATIHFGSGMNGNFTALERAYQGSEFQLIWIEELGQWVERCYRYLFSRLRRATAVKAPLRMRGSANPGGIGHEWIRSRFVEEARNVSTRTLLKDDLHRRRYEGQELPSPRVYENPPSPEAVDLAKEMGKEAEGAFFVPAFATDNPGLDWPSYRSQLAKLDPVTREQFEWGDWWVTIEGRLFKLDMFQYLDAEPSGIRWIRAWDLAGTKPTKRGHDPAWTAGVRMGLWVDREDRERQRLVVAHLNHFREDPGPTEDNVKGQAKADGRMVPVIIEQEPGSAGKTVIQNNYQAKLIGYRVVGIPKTGAKEEYWRLPSAIAHGKNLFLVRGDWNKRMTDELTGLPNSPKKDIADALATGAHWLTGPGLAMMRLWAMAQL